VYESEFIEGAALRDLHAAAGPDIVRSLGLDFQASGHRVISVAAGLPDSAIVINRALGLGLDEAETEAAIADLVGIYRDAGVGRFFIQRHPQAAPVALTDWLQSAGLAQARGWQKFSRGCEPAPAVRTELEVRPVGAGDSAGFASIVCAAFDLGEVAEPWLACLPGRPGWHVFMSFADGQPAGAGALFAKDGVGWTDFGATAPAFRRMGSQGAILARRIDHAISLGCERIYTCTGEAVEGDPQHSYGNIMKLGFRPDYVRENYAPPRAEGI
jgi:GNAT superfamily N-acetyltransferase